MKVKAISSDSLEEIEVISEMLNDMFPHIPYRLDNIDVLNGNTISKYFVKDISYHISVDNKSNCIIVTVKHIFSTVIKK